jgi:4,5-DOPA dioxygenase extradiol
MASAHWETTGSPSVSLSLKPETIHDFGGFPAELFAIEYPAPGSPEVAGQTAILLEQAGYTVSCSPDRGLDHGAWVPMRLMYPEADMPVFQLSLLRDATPADHERLGSALAALRDAGVLIIGSGSMTHNLVEFRGQGIDAQVPSWVSDFDGWMRDMLLQNAREALRDYRRMAPFAERNHPTEEHLLPLFVAMGAAGSDAVADRVHASCPGTFQQADARTADFRHSEITAVRVGVTAPRKVAGIRLPTGEFSRKIC